MPLNSSDISYWGLALYAQVAGSNPFKAEATAALRHERTFASIKARLAQGHEADDEISEQTLSATLRLPDTRKSPCFGTS